VIAGIEFANSNSYDVILLDLMLPDMDGMAVCVCCL
jgi:DNA-binding response OmpR family regulator